MLSGVIELFQEISAPIKVGWMLWILWCVAQIVWYQRGRALPAQVPAPRLEARQRPSTEPRLETPVDVPAPRQAEVPAAAVSASLDSRPPRRRRRPAIDASDAMVGPV